MQANDLMRSINIQKIRHIKSGSLYTIWHYHKKTAII
jgi:hypothetical protein